MARETPFVGGKPEGTATGRASSGMPEPRPADLLATKLYVPVPPHDLVERARLLARLDTGLRSALTLISAPAGFGKTTILADWLRQQTERQQVHAAWLTVDAGDSEPYQFLRYLVAALQTVAPDVGATILALLQASQPPPLERLLTLLLNDLAHRASALPSDIVLVLDDYHVLRGPAIHEAVAFLLDHRPPRLHVVVATREDPPLPLSRLRARGQLAELRTAELRFTPDEAALFLQEVMSLDLAAGEVEALEQRTEGWIAGLQLAALAMRDRTDVGSFIGAFTGSNRFIVDYLTDEVVSRLPPHLRTFVLQTAVLDRMCGALCDAVLLGMPDDGTPVIGDTRPASTHEQAYSQALLEELERANLFVVPLDADRQWYRYHHLFADVLRARLAGGARGDEVARLHRRAAAWYECNGLVAEAVEHALAGADFERVERLIDQRMRASDLRRTELRPLLH